MSFKTTTYQAIALAGITQATHLVHQLATTGSANEKALHACLNSLIILDAENPVDIYGGLEGVELGLVQLNTQLSSTRVNNPQEARYAASLVFLEDKFANEVEMQAQVTKKIEIARKQSEHFGVDHENVIANFADIYHTTISNISPRVMINGEQSFLSSVDIINKIRALLLAGIRSAMLWKHCGGSRWRFLFFRRKIQREVQFLLAEIERAK